MPKTGWKYTKQAPNKGKTNMLKRSNASSKVGRTAPKRKDLNMRSAETIKRLKMYTNGKAIRNKEGKVVGGQFMMSDRAGDRKITSATGRIAPDRRWFGNTRVVGATELDKFRQEMSESMADPYSVVLKRKKLPMRLLQDAAEMVGTDGANRNGLLENEPFEHTFGKHTRRKRVKLEQYFETRSSESKAKIKSTTVGVAVGGDAKPVPRGPLDGSSDDQEDGGGEYGALLSAAQQSNQAYEEINNREGIVPWGRDNNLEPVEGEGVDWRPLAKDDLFLKGQSKRIWGEFFKVLDCSDIVLHVIDARNVPGTRCTMLERHLETTTSANKHKHLVFVLNKVDLVPNWVAKRWIGELSKVRPTIAFHASMTHAFGKGALISLLRQFGKLHQEKKQLSVGVVGYPNVGKSSVINTLLSKKSCRVAPIPGETKIWQYITLFKRIALIDCPGIVVDTAGDTEEDSVLKGVVRAERLEHPEEFVDGILKHVKREHIIAQYQLTDERWTTSTELMEKVAYRSGRLLKGGEPCLRSAAIMLIHDFQRGRLPHYVAPPELKQKNEQQQQQEEAIMQSKTATTINGIQTKAQNLNDVGEETMKHHDNDDEDEEEDDHDDDKKKEDAVKPSAAAAKMSTNDDEKDECSESEEEEEVPLIAKADWDD